MRTLLSALLAVALLSGCDIISEPKNGQAGPINPDGDNVARRVLLEDCTGHLCSNCPQAAELADQLKAVYGDRLVVVAVHMKPNFAGPVSPNYTTDFRTDAGNAYDQQFTIPGLPAGLIDRKPYDGAMAIGTGSWSSAVAQQMDLPPTVDLRFDGLSYSSATNMVTATVKAIVLNTLPAPQNLTIYLTESHIIDWQEDNRLPFGQQDISDYEFNHVLRGALNSPFGQAFIPGDAQPGDTLVSTFTYPLPAAGAVNQVLNTNNCSLVAYVYNTTGAAQFEVQQVVERKFVP